MLYASDARWWTVYGEEVKDCERWTCDRDTPDGVNWIEAVNEQGLSINPRRIHLGGNSGYQAVGLAYLWGAARIVLLGYDMQRTGGKSHHHGDHDGGLPNLGDMGEWARRMVQLGIDLRARGVDVINATRQTAITCFERMTIESALSTGATSGPLRDFRGLPLTVMCVLRSGGDYYPEYVRKLRDGVAKHLTIPHRFVCLSDVPVPCERIALMHGWSGWWSKIEMFRSGVITGPTLYLDLDTVVVGNIDRVMSIPYDFAMLNILETEVKVGNSGAMWIARPFPHVYERFAEKPDYWIDYHVRRAENRYMGDQAWISDQFEHIPKLHHALPGFFRSYKYDGCQERIPSGCAVVCFGGKPRPHQAGGWVKRVWT